MYWRLKSFASRASARSQVVCTGHATIPFGWTDDLGSWVGLDPPSVVRSWRARTLGPLACVRAR
jgi:hypothetical protein